MRDTTDLARFPRQGGVTSSPIAYDYELEARLLLEHGERALAALFQQTARRVRWAAAMRVRRVERYAQGQA